jgi:hypothetical protein
MLGENSRQTPGWLTEIHQLQPAVVRAARGACWQAPRRTGGVPGPAALAQDELVVKAQVEEAQVEEMDHPGPSGGQSVVRVLCVSYMIRSGAVTLPLE